MRRYLGFPVLAAGLAIGAVTHFPWLLPWSRSLPPPSSASLPTPAPDFALAPPVDDDPASPSFSSGSTSVPKSIEVASRAERTSSTHTLTSAPGAALEPQNAEGAAAPASTVQLSWITSVKPADSYARYNLIRDIQRELRRVGCYGGEIDGSWGAGSKWALGAFIERVNASLPTDEPDYILLSLLRAHPAGTCGRGCPKGQSAVAGNRCVPNAILAASSRKSLAEETAQSKPPAGEVTASSETAASPAQVLPARDGLALASRQEALPGRMSVGGPATVETRLGPGLGGAGVSGTPPSRTAALGGADPAAAAEVVPPGQAAPGADIAASAAGPIDAPALAPPPAVRSAADRRPRSRSYGTRSVQRLFTHPLGRM
jgi:hypothetical protein